MTDVIAVVCGVVALGAIVAFERSVRRGAAAQVAAISEWANRAVREARQDAAEMRAWASDEVKAARDEIARLTRQIESRNLAEHAAAEEMIARSRGILPPPPPRQPSAVDEMLAGRPPAGAGRNGA